jgi:PAS domain S-box-containing protein
MDSQAPQGQPLRKREAAPRNVLPLLQTQFTVAKVLAAAEDLQSSLPSIIASICINLGWELGAFWQYAATRPVLVCTNISAADEALGRFIAESRKNELLAGEGLPGRVFASSQPEWIANISDDKDFLSASAAAQVGLRSAFAFPVLVGNDAVAVLEFLSSQFREPDQELLETMVALGQQIGQFIMRKEAEEALQQSLELYRKLTDSACDAIITVDETGSILLTNRAAESTFGYGAAEMKGQNLTLLMPEHSRMRYEHLLEGYLQAGKKRPDWQAIEVVGRHKDGHEIAIELSFGEFLLKGQRFFTGFMRDKKQSAKVEGIKFAESAISGGTADEITQRIDKIKALLASIAQGVSPQQPATVAQQELEKINEIVRALALERKAH